MRALLLASLLLAAAPVAAGDPRPLAGSYQLTPASLVDPAPDEKPDTHVRFHLTGKAAADIFAALPGKPRRDACLGDGSVAKSQGRLVCTRSPGGAHECSFGLDLRTGQAAAGAVC